ncbi:MAG: ATP-binding protein [Gammaproteobacteria bacterium]|nr:ATP-binding protein [Gammaproteobacteria bacterium]
MTAPDQTINLSIASQLDSVSGVGSSVSNWCRELGMDDEHSFQIELCTVEAVNNSIIHAYRNNPDEQVNVECTLCDYSSHNGKFIRVKISDTGQAMTQAIPDKLVSQDSESGRGWYIMKQWTDSVHYSSIDGVNTTTLEKSIELK